MRTQVAQSGGCVTPLSVQPSNSLLLTEKYPGSKEIRGGHRFKKIATLWLLPLVAASIVGCGGGGGGVVGYATLAPFVSFSSFTPPGTLVVNGSSQQVSYTATGSPQNGNVAVTSVSAASAFAPGASASLTFDGSGNATKASFTSAQGTSITVDAAAGDTITQNLGLFAGRTLNYQNNFMAPIPQSAQWDYQTFGVWTTGSGTGTGAMGVVTFGAETSGASIPTSGSAIYSGASIGQYVDTNGVPYYAVANVSANADFINRSLGFSTSSTTTINQNTATTVVNAALNMTGTLNYAAGTNLFSGSVSTTGGGVGGGAMAGTATGKFYGPAAQEIGGTFVLTSGTVGSGGATYIGGFGGKR